MQRERKVVEEKEDANQERNVANQERNVASGEKHGDAKNQKKQDGHTRKNAKYVGLDNFLYIFIYEKKVRKQKKAKKEILFRKYTKCNLSEY